MMNYSGAAASKYEVEFEVEENSRKMTEFSVKGNHLSLEDLRKHILNDPTIWKKVLGIGRKDTDQIKSKYGENPRILDYLENNIPEYPTPVEFHLSSVAHITDEEPFQSILQSEMIKPPRTEYSWWTLAVTEEEIESAEIRYLQRMGIQGQNPFLKKFTTSPVFQLDKSRYGNYRLTFPLADLINLYKDQNCDGEEPVFRMFKTMFYKQEVVYAVLIHSPQYNKLFGELPLLEESRFAGYKPGKMIWKVQAMSSDHRYSLDPSEIPFNVTEISSKYYVWDQVCLAFHLPLEKALIVPRDRLIEAFDACRLQERNVLGYKTWEFEQKFKNAKKEEENLKKELEIKREVKCE
ncbi:uncharacterized protein [Hoplias malabaricus]|uniref:uncharacterized protein n=1 Tax=Hoplias malabaricus TaxID=27720 RepID=UPI003462B0C0